MVKYFAYGSNMDLQRIKSRGVNVYNIEKGVLNNWRLVFNVIDEDVAGSGFANIQPYEKSQVEGIIYSIDELSVINLDKFEDYPIDYSKEILKVKDESNQYIECLVYVGQLDRLKPNLKPTSSYLQFILNGRSFLSERYYEKLANIDTLNL
jgi:gamma-glutamylcyclotransferase (GGCT)/AIG2-like uncharacterized protein YtfP